MPNWKFPDGDSPDPDEVRAADARLVEIIRQVGRNSPEFRYAREALMASGLGALLKMGPWRALDEGRRRRWSVPTPVPFSFYEEYPTLCFLAARASIDGFMQRQILDGGWRPDGGSSLRWYYRNSALNALIDQYRTYHREEQVRHASLDQRRGDGDEPETDGCHDALVRPAENPEQAAVRRDSIRRKLANADKRTRRMLELHSMGYTYREIADAMDTTVDAVDAALRRFRNQSTDDDDPA